MKLTHAFLISCFVFSSIASANTKKSCTEIFDEQIEEISSARKTMHAMGGAAVVLALPVGIIFEGAVMIPSAVKLKSQKATYTIVEEAQRCEGKGLDKLYKKVAKQTNAEYTKAQMCADILEGDANTEICTGRFSIAPTSSLYSQKELREYLIEKANR